MQKIVNGKRYNTDTAEKMVYISNGMFASDFGYRSWSLYRTSKGAWFMLHEGGPMSDMGQDVGGGGVGGSMDIEPLSDEQALAWLKENINEDNAEETLDEYFDYQAEDA